MIYLVFISQSDILLYVIWPTTVQKATILQVTTLLTTFKNVIFPGHNHC